MIKRKSGNVSRVARHERIRKNMSGTGEVPRLNVFRSINNIYAQIIDDVSGTTLVSAAKKVGQIIAKRALEKDIKSVVFDRGGYLYHGRVKELAEGAREGGLEF